MTDSSTENLLDKVRLRYTTDSKPGFSRSHGSKNFSYFDLKGKKITDKAEIERINSLAIPPAWKDVWICPFKNGHLQATGRDDRGRTQYRYHPLWTEISQQKKFEHMMIFARLLPKIRHHIQNDLNKKGLVREKVLATVVWLLENTLIRVGNEEYEKENKSYGLTTLKNRHVDVWGGDIHFTFKGKSGVYHDVDIKSKKVAKVVKQCQDLPGQDLFEYRDEEGVVQTITSEDVNDYLQNITGEEITAKDFRTWAGTMLAAKMVDHLELPQTKSETKKALTEVVKKVAQNLRNLPATSRKYYIHPAVFDAYTKGYTISNLKTHKMFKKALKVRDLGDVENGIVGLLSIFKH